jgi:phage repressor protein C with HTH and peptisase S24 domain
MLPALSDGDIVLVRNGGEVHPGHIVVVSWAQRPDQLSIKRAIWRDGDGWFVVGDNHRQSTDSNRLGPAQVHGVVRWRLWPRPQRLRRLS